MSVPRGVGVPLGVPLSSPGLAAATPDAGATPGERLHLIYRLAALGIPVGVELRPQDAHAFELEYEGLLQAVQRAGAAWVQWPHSHAGHPGGQLSVDLDGDTPAPPFEERFTQPVQLCAAGLGLALRPPAFEHPGERSETRLAPTLWERSGTGEAERPSAGGQLEFTLP